MKTLNLSDFLEFKKLVNCPICLCLLHSPVRLSCSHIFCEVCINTSMQFKNLCPICCKKINKRQIARESSQLTNIVEAYANLLDRVIVEEEEKTSNVPRDEKLQQPVTAGLCSLNVSVVEAPIETTEVNRSEVEANDDTNQQVVIINKFTPGFVVNVLPRTWIGINKLGGAGWILSCHELEDGIFYDVKYILDGKVDHNIPAVFVEPFQELQRTGRRAAKKVESMAGGRHNNSDHLVSGSGESKKSRKKRPNTTTTTTTTTTMSSTTNTTTTTTMSSTSNTAVGNSSSTGHSDSSSIDAYAPSSSSSSSESRIDRRSQNLVILTSTTSFEVESTLEAFSHQFSKPLPSSSSSSSSFECCGSIRIATRFDSAVTHLVVAVGPDKVLRQRTMKYMQALVSGAWILSSDWIAESMKAGNILAEEDFEIIRNSKAHRDNAPRRARLDVHSRPPVPEVVSTNSGSSRLFRNLHVLLYGQFPTPGPPRSDLEDLLVRGGAVNFRDLKSILEAFQAEATSKSSLVIICSDEIFGKDCMDEIESTCISVSRSQKQSHINIVSPLWILDSITNYEVQSPENYLLLP